VPYMAKATIHRADPGKQRCASLLLNGRDSMALRPELLLKPPTQEHVDRVREAVNDILSGLDRGEDVAERIRSLTDLTGREYIPNDFEEIEARMSEDTLCAKRHYPRTASFPTSRGTN
jgi:hypothetical protein